jgi:hypothetical protein
MRLFINTLFIGFPVDSKHYDEIPVLSVDSHVHDMVGHHSININH